MAFTGWRVVGRRCRSGPETWLAAFVWCAFLIMAYAVALSALRRLAPAGMLLLAALGALAMVARAPSPTEQPKAPPLTPRQARRLLAALLPPIAFTAWALLLLARAPETGDDNMAYHLPRVAHWIAERGVVPFLANDPRIGSFPPNGNVLQLVPALFLRHDRLCGVVQLAAMAATGLGIFAIARAAGASRAGGVFAALGWFSVPTMAAQAHLSMVDVTASAFVTAAVYFLVRRPPTAFHLFTCLLAAVLCVGTKQHLAVIAAPIAVLAAVAMVRGHRRAVLAAALGVVVAALAGGAVFALWNRAVWGHPSGLDSVRSVVVGPGVAAFVKNVELLLLPIGWWPGAPEWSPRWGERLALDGLGLYWTAVTGVSLLLLGWDSLKRRAPEPRGWWLPAALALAAGLVLLGLLRHQQAIYRLVLPLVAVLSVLHARTFERVTAGRDAMRWALLGAAWVAAAGVLGWQGLAHSRRRHVAGAWASATTRYGMELAPFAAELERRSLGRPLRVGVITGQYFPHGLFFGRDYRNTVVPLSYDPPATPAAIEALRLDALWVSVSAWCQVDVFRREFQPPAAGPTRSWAPSPRAFDEDFLEAYSPTIQMVDVRPTLRALADPASTWGVVARNHTGALFVRGEGRRMGTRRLCGDDARRPGDVD